MKVFESTIKSPAIPFFLGHLTGLDFTLLKSFVVGHYDKDVPGGTTGWCRKIAEDEYRILIKIHQAEKFPQTIYLKEEKGKFKLKVKNVDEDICFIMFHELFHFLSLTKQIDKENTEKNANEFAMMMLDKFRLVDM